MKYWVLSPNVYNDHTQDDWKKAIARLNRAFIGYGDDTNFGGIFQRDIQKGDAILIAQGANWQKNFYLCGVVASDSIWEEVPDTPGEAQNRKLKHVLTKENLDSLNLDFKNSTWGDSKQPATLYYLKPDENEIDSAIVSKLSKAINEIKSKAEMNKITDLLKFKTQIILQGPPGTGKTRMAKLIAKELTQKKTIGSAIHKIDEFFKTFDPSPVQEKRKELNQLLDDFQKKFPKEHLKNLKREEYAIGTGTNDSFCWWIERGLKQLGYYVPVFPDPILIYWSREKDDYSTHFKHSSKLSEEKDTEQAMSLLAGIISDMVMKKKFDASNPLGSSLSLKILHSYYPEEFFPINSKKCLENLLKLFSIDSSKMNILEMNLRVQDLYTKKKKEFKADVTSIEFMRFLFDNFDLNGTISLESNEVLSAGEFKIIQFHPAYSYEDFVRGISANTNKDGKVTYSVENRTIAQFAQRLWIRDPANYVLIIDEINRANLPAVLGELIYALEYRYDEDKPEETTVESMYALKKDETDEEGSKELKLPRNLFVIGTMNTADRSVGHIDYAIRRRFAFVDMPPDETVVTYPLAQEFFKEMQNIFDKYTAGDFDKNDVMLGHSYFLADNTKDLKLKLKYEVLPILKEYLKDGVLNKHDESVKAIDALATKIESISE